MDTTWYAIDRAGHVAQFASGEEGAVPWAACRASWDEIYDELVVARIAAAHRGGPLDEERILTTTLEASSDPVERRLVGEILAGDDAARDVYADWLEAHGGSRDGWSPRERAVYEVDKVIRPIPPQSLPPQWSGILAFATADDREMFRSQHAYAMTSSHEVDARLGIAHAIRVDELHQYAFDDFWEAGAIRAAFLVEKQLAPHVVGLYELGCSFSGPYHLRVKPHVPLLHAELPEPVRARLGALAFPRLAFATAGEIDPERHHDCQVYGR